ncbi:hypothetical protein BKA70DRAFT_1239708 [Coprinopsis sp. MPI-PUGE-AT-0042]|nr:hypothetical protein BKA70DRAFT_1239708 [Coprinopsis sp. MPI-PUGE-AT-0042]
MLSLLGTMFHLIAYCFSGFLNLFQRPSRSMEDVEGRDHELDGISYKRPSSDPNISSLSDVYFTGLSRFIQEDHVNVATASTRRCLLIGAKCTHHFAVSVGVYPGVDTRHRCLVQELILYQYVANPASRFDVFYKTNESAFHLVRSLDTVGRVEENRLLKVYFPEVLHGSGVRYSVGNILVVKTDLMGAVVDILESEEAVVWEALGLYIKSLYIVIPSS